MYGCVHNNQRTILHSMYSILSEEGILESRLGHSTWRKGILDVFHKTLGEVVVF